MSRRRLAVTGHVCREGLGRVLHDAGLAAVELATNIVGATRRRLGAGTLQERRSSGIRFRSETTTWMVPNQGDELARAWEAPLSAPDGLILQLGGHR
jgi:hypothetical protein